MLMQEYLNLKEIDKLYELGLSVLPGYIKRLKSSLRSHIMDAGGIWEDNSELTVYEILELSRKKWIANNRKFNLPLVQSLINESSYNLSDIPLDKILIKRGQDEFDIHIISNSKKILDQIYSNKTCYINNVLHGSKNYISEDQDISFLKYTLGENTIKLTCSILSDNDKIDLACDDLNSASFKILDLNWTNHTSKQQHFSNKIKFR